MLCVAAIAAVLLLRFRRPEDQFGHLMTVGGGYLEKKDAANAIATYQKAEKLAPENLDVHLDLANAYLLAGNSPAAIAECQTALNLDHNDPAAYYLMGCACLRQNQAEPAVQALQQSQKIDPAVTALNFQLGLAQEQLGHLEDAVKEFETVIQYEPDHPSAHYRLSRLYQRLGRAPEAEQEMAKHQQILAKSSRPPGDAQAFEKCKYTQPRAAFALEQPERQGIPVRFVNDTFKAFGQQSSRYHGPIGVLDYNHDGRNSLFVMDESGFRLLNSSNGHFAPLGGRLPGTIDLKT
jgi:cytochrome c-type biogenesis protein CcmH/NrfG